MSDYKEAYKELAHNQAVLVKNCPELMTAFRGIPKEALKPKHLDTKTKELMAVAIAISVRCEGCILAHVRDALKAGATMEELAETVEVAVLMGGGPATAYGAKALAVAESLVKEK
ncbi:carboxymuconolactone decarboxylase family protein [Enterococcus sp. BWR-S5]|uniref:carboxymuconolactone decarboxylase family protein n=1 Tax=Enterococcus sp. BWR-S5 TaxID=2787714 RepID=UPI0019210796|nr:carboxymuconolactone decarboxylase family protein [Enterococcus sp. BWR-S5]MBL1227470.1 carboxymuconolactone decarboxylase family protein [Enterococcus sp. BWR-S5]